MSATDKRLKVYAYAQHCVMAGRAVPASAIDEDEPCDDYVVFDGTPEELLAEADSLLNPSPNKWPNGYACRLAKTIQEAVYWERPDLRPEETDGGDDE